MTERCFTVAAVAHKCGTLCQSIRTKTVWRSEGQFKRRLKTHLFGLWDHRAYSDFLADRTSGRAIATVWRLSVCLSVTLCIVAKRCVLEQKLLLRAYRKSYMRNRLTPNEWPWPLFRGRIKVTSTVALHLTLNISETIRDRGLVLKDYQ